MAAKNRRKIRTDFSVTIDTGSMLLEFLRSGNVQGYIAISKTILEMSVSVTEAGKIQLTGKTWEEQKVELFNALNGAMQRSLDKIPESIKKDPMRMRIIRAQADNAWESIYGWYTACLNRQWGKQKKKQENNQPQQQCRPTYQKPTKTVVEQQYQQREYKDHTDPMDWMKQVMTDEEIAEESKEQ